VKRGVGFDKADAAFAIVRPGRNFGELREPAELVSEHEISEPKALTPICMTQPHGYTAARNKKSPLFVNWSAEIFREPHICD
jgi:hypothetical protein